MLREALLHVCENFAEAASQPFAAHPLADFIRKDVAQTVRELITLPQPFKVEASPGKGNWASVPWVAVFDPLVTERATNGYYVVYLFSQDGENLHLSLNQGATAVLEEFGSTGHSILRDRATLMRARLSDFSEICPSTSISLGQQRLPKGYESGHAFGISYQARKMPSEERLLTDLENIMRAYLALTFRGGVEPSIELETITENPTLKSVLEIRRYQFHRRIERNPRASAAAKKHHGYACQCCGFDFEKRYGELGRNYIEAHHCKPMHRLEENTPISLDVSRDFAVLCANCHRMIHRLPDSGNVNLLRRLLSDSRSMLSS